MIQKLYLMDNFLIRLVQKFKFNKIEKPKKNDKEVETKVSISLYQKYPSFDPNQSYLYV